MIVNNASKIIMDDSRVMLLIVMSLIDSSRGDIYNCSMFIVVATGAFTTNIFSAVTSSAM
jgi:hypothetical protein